MRYGEETIERIREAAGLVELIGSTVALRKVGQTWKGLCPFHQEKTPSFTVNPDRQAYHCFGCGAGGDCFRFVMETEKLSFVEAVQALADRFGVPLPKPAEEEQHGRAYQALEEAATFYRRVLEDPEAGRAARDYLAGRGLSPSTLEAFGVGLAPAGWDQLLSRLGPRLGTGALIEAGLVVARERGEGHYDRFRNRIVVPLRLPSGRVVGFGGRALGDEEPKYLNSPETAVYRKGRVLFGLDRARAAIREQGRAVLVEGYFDVLGLAQAGVTEAIATCGTALTGEQCRIVQRTAPAILLVFVGDAAEDPIVSGLLVEEAAGVLSFDARALALEVEVLRRGGTRQRPAAPAAVAERRAPLVPTPREEKVARDLETGFLKLLVAHPELIGEAASQVDPSWFRVPSTRAVAEALLGEARRDPSEMLADPELESSLRERLSEILTSAGAVDQAEETYGEWVTKLKGRAIDWHRAELQREIARVSRIPGAEVELKRLMMEMQDPAAALRDLRRASEARRKERA